MIVRGERAGLIAAVESKDAETVFGSRELGGTEIGGVESAPYGVEIAAGRTDTDIIAHNIGVGAGIPTETETPQEGVDTTKAKTTGRGGEIVVEEETAGVGIDYDSIIRNGEAGCGYVIMNRVGTDYAVEGVDIMGVG
jgi:hypothetical protein